MKLGGSTKRSFFIARSTPTGWPCVASRTILSGCNLAISLTALELFDEAKTLNRDQLLPPARRSLGADHDLTLKLNHNLAAALANDPERTRNALR